jgi:hypothetical protein
VRANVFALQCRASSTWTIREEKEEEEVEEEVEENRKVVCFDQLKVAPTIKN